MNHPDIVKEAPPYVPRVVSFDELRFYGVLMSKRQIDRQEARNLFPKRVPMSASRVGWVTTEIIAFVDACIASRSMAPGTLGSDNMMRKPAPRVPAPMLGLKGHRGPHLKYPKREPASDADATSAPRAAPRANSRSGIQDSLKK